MAKKEEEINEESEEKTEEAEEEGEEEKIPTTFMEFLNSSPDNSICPFLRGGYRCIKKKCRFWLTAESPDDEKAMASECSFNIAALSTSALVGVMMEVAAQLSDVLEAGEDTFNEIEDEVDGEIPDLSEGEEEEEVGEIPDLSG